MPTRIFKLSKILDDPRYEGFSTSDRTFLQTCPYPRDFRECRELKVQRVPDNWTAPTLKGRVRFFNDYPTVGSIPAFSLRAVIALRDLLEPNGQLLPIAGGNYFAYNLLTIADALDRDASEGIAAFEISRFEFRPNLVESLVIFRIPEKPYLTFVTDIFVNRVAQADLKGFDFQLAWPLPLGISWKSLALSQKKIRGSAGLPSGQTANGNSVIIALSLEGCSPPSLDLVKQSVEKLGHELNLQLVDLSSERPVIGNFEYADFEIEGVCRLLLSCPDAAALVDMIRPWLKTLDWPNGFKVLMRDRHFVDSGANEIGVDI